MAFKKLSSTFVPSLSADFNEYVDDSTGAIHVHLDNKSDLKSFLVAFPTYPTSDNGVAHILEHMALCGSKRYPVRDPFMSMVMGRSTSCFMNAMTYPDRTVYPFATKVDADFYNLLDVYLDAAFFPTLHEHDFDQEGCRVEYENGELAFKGVVLNEMKEVADDPLSVLMAKIDATLFEGTCYQYNPGGDPRAIPSLRHSDLVEFHKRHYHPSQAVFMTAGDIDVEKFQTTLHARATSKFEKSTRMYENPQEAWSEPRSIGIEIPSYEKTSKNKAFVFSWILGESSCPESYIKASLLEYGLVGSASSPVSRALEGAGFGFPHRVNGTSNHARMLTLALGMEGLTTASVAKAKKLIWSALETAAHEGVSSEVLSTHLRDIVFSQRQIDNDFMPHDLSNLCTALPYVFEGVAACTPFQIEEILRSFTEQLKSPDFFKNMVKDLLNNQHRLDVTSTAKNTYARDEAKEERKKLHDIEKALTPQGIDSILSRAASLKLEQSKVNDPNALPKIDIKEIPREVPPNINGVKQANVTTVKVVAGGLINAAVAFDISHLHDSKYWPYLSLYTMLITEVGVGQRSYADAATWRQKMAPSLTVGVASLQEMNHDRLPRSCIEFIAEGLQEQAANAGHLLCETILSSRFDELDRIAYLSEMFLNDTLSNAANDGAQFASLEAAAPFSPIKHLTNLLEGLPKISFLTSVAGDLGKKNGARDFCSVLSEIHQQVIRSPAVITCTGDEIVAAKTGKLIADALEALPTAIQKNAQIKTPKPRGRMLHLESQGNSCYQVWAAPRLDSGDSGHMSVLAELLTNKVLHRLIREAGGAYDARARHDVTNGLFMMSSDRDPRLQGTYDDFQEAVQWVLNGKFEQESVDEAVVCVIKNIDRPKSPFQEAYSSLLRQKMGVTDEMRQSYRSSILNCKVDDIKDAAKRWLTDVETNKCAFAGSRTDGRDMELFQITL